MSDIPSSYIYPSEFIFPSQSTPHWQRWTLYDPYTTEIFTFSINPSEGGEPAHKKNVTFLRTTAGHNIPCEGAQSPQEVSFKGVLRSTADRDALAAWAAKPYQVQMTNDMAESRWIWFDLFTPTRKRVASRPYKSGYDLHGFLLDIA